MWRRLWQTLWQTWTIDKPAAFSDRLWDIFVVQFAAWLDRLTVRQVIAFIPVVILVLAYAHNIPIPPELMLVGDVLAYIDIVSVLLLVSVMSRARMILFVVTQAWARAHRAASMVGDALRRIDIRHRRAAGPKRRRGAIKSDKTDDGYPAMHALAWT